jgi:hypothetical protein
MGSMCRICLILDNVEYVFIIHVIGGINIFVKVSCKMVMCAFNEYGTCKDLKININEERICQGYKYYPPHMRIHPNSIPGE